MKTLKIYKTPTANKKIIEILRWTAKKWGKKQAIEYSSILDKTIISVANGIILTKTNPAFSTRFSYCMAKQHYIFFEYKKDMLIVATIFHINRNIKDRLQEENLTIDKEIKAIYN